MRMTDTPEKVEFITSVQRRRRRSAGEKMRMVEESLQPGASISLAHTPEEIVATLRQAEVLVGQGKTMADQFRPRWPKLGKLMDDSENDVLA